jgi:hypothetical protein
MKVAEDLFKSMNKWLLNPPTQLNSNADRPLDDVSRKEKKKMVEKAHKEVTSLLVSPLLKIHSLITKLVELIKTLVVQLNENIN